MKTKEKKDLGLVIQDTLSLKWHKSTIFGSTWRMFQNTMMAFHCMDKNMLKKIISTMLHPKLEYAAMVWSPHMKKDWRKLERIQRTATKMASALKDLPYEKRLKETRLPTLQARREREEI